MVASQLNRLKARLQTSCLTFCDIRLQVVSMRETQLRSIWEKTKGHCHFCGDRVVFEKRGGKKVEDLTGYWEADHIIQRAKGGSKSAENCLPACTKCNKLRWHRAGENLRELLVLGAIRQFIVAFYTTGHRMLFVPLHLTAHRVVSCFSIRQFIVALLAERFMPNNHF